MESTVIVFSDVLVQLTRAGQPLEPTVIAERLLVTTGSMTSLLDNLEKRGLIRRQPHPDSPHKPAVQAEDRSELRSQVDIDTSAVGSVG